MKTIICTTGTSVAQGCLALGVSQRQAGGWSDAAPDLRREIHGRLARLALATEEGRRQASAEIYSLDRIGVGPDDRVALLATDTAEGRACAEAVAGAIATAFGISGSQVRIHRIPALQVRDERRLREEGLPQLVDTVLAQYVDNPQVRYGSEIVLNLTGGFKGVVPFLAVIGMIFRLRTVYIFESSEALIVLPPMPLTFDLGLFERAAPAIEHINRETAVRESEYFSRIVRFQEHERDLFLGFIESAGAGMVTLSPLALALHRIEESGEHDVLLSPAARAALEASDGIKRLALERILLRVASPLWRSIHQHIRQDEIIYFKPGSTAERAAAVIRDSKVYVCHLFVDHDDYERALAAKKTAPVRYDDFEPWAPPASASDVERAYDQTLEAEVLRLREELDRLKNAQGQKRGEEMQDLKNQIRTKDALYRDARHKIAEQDTEIAALKRQLTDALIQTGKPKQ